VEARRVLGFDEVQVELRPALFPARRLEVGVRRAAVAGGAKIADERHEGLDRGVAQPVGPGLDGLGTRSQFVLGPAMAGVPRDVEERAAPCACPTSRWHATQSIRIRAVAPAAGSAAGPWMASAMGSWQRRQADSTTRRLTGVIVTGSGKHPDVKKHERQNPSRALVACFPIAPGGV
jgi:hypothetical protein